MLFTKNHADPALFFKWHPVVGFMIWLSWTDDLLCFGPKEEVQKEIEKIKTKFEVDDVGELKEYLGCQVRIKPDKNPDKPPGLTLIQSVIIQTLIDSFYKTGSTSSTPAFQGVQLSPTVEGEENSKEEMADYHTTKRTISTSTK